MATTELTGGEWRASISESNFKIDTVRGATKGIIGDRTDEGVGGEWSEAVQAAGPISDDTVRTSVPEGKVSEEGSLDIT